MKKILIIILFITPSITFASWWNPLSWFKQMEIKNDINKTEILEKRIAELESKLNTNANSIVSTTSISTKNTEAQPDFKTLKPVVVPSSKKYKSKVVLPKIDSLKTQSLDQPSPSGTLCNGTYYSACGSNTIFICPIDGGKAYCQNSQSEMEIQLKNIFDDYNKQVKIREEQDSIRQNSPECIAAKSDLKLIEDEDKLLSNMSSLAKPGSTESYSYTSQSASLAIKKSAAYDKISSSCYGVYVKPPKIYSTDCYGSGYSVSCYSN